MTALRRFLQCLILACSGVLLVTRLLQPEPGFYGLLGLLCLTAMLLQLTRALKPVEPGRPERGHAVALGGVLILLGVCSVLNGAGYLLDLHALPADGGNCRALCSLTLMIRDSFGEVAGKLAALILWAGSGAFLCEVGRRTLRDARVAGDSAARTRSGRNANGIQGPARK
jgi:hypothetical protein